jgi:hypothetical protein
VAIILGNNLFQFEKIGIKEENIFIPIREDWDKRREYISSNLREDWDNL